MLVDVGNVFGFADGRDTELEKVLTILGGNAVEVLLLLLLWLLLLLLLLLHLGEEEER